METVVAVATILSGFFCFFAAAEAETIVDAEAAATTKRAVIAATLLCSICFFRVAEAVTAAASNLHTKPYYLSPLPRLGRVFRLCKRRKA